MPGRKSAPILLILLGALIWMGFGVPVRVAEVDPAAGTSAPPGRESPAAVTAEPLSPSIGAVPETAIYTEASTPEPAGIGFLSLLPPLVAISMALLLRQVLVSLFTGVLLGAFLAYGYNPLAALLRTADHYLLNALADRDHAAILIFTLMLGGMTGVISRAGGASGVVRLLGRFARNARSTQLATWFMGLLIFFDDYANSLLVGSSMRPMCDRMKVSREKLAYIVDSTAAPVASIAIFSTWIGMEVGLIGDAFVNSGYEGDPYLAFLRSIPYRFYPILTLILGFLIASTGRDFGPMRKAEERAASGGGLLRPGATPMWDVETAELLPVEGKPHRWMNAIIPVAIVGVATFTGLYIDGSNSLDPAAGTAGFGEVLGAADSFRVLLWASLLGLLSAIILAVGQKILSLRQTMDAMMGGCRSMLVALAVLLLAWSLGQVCDDLGTAEYLLAVVGGALDPRFLPVLTFLISALVSFATGTSWGTMSIIIPLAVPLSLKLSIGAGLPEPVMESILFGTISSVLAGAVFGDHCSPISDTTILSSLASSSDHVDHVRTQLPYALLAGGLGLILGDFASAFGVSPYVSLALSIIILILVVRFLGRPRTA